MARAPIHPLWGLVEVAAVGALFCTGLWLVGPRVEAGSAGVAAYWVWVIAGGLTVLWLSPVVLHCDPPELRGWGRRRANDPGAFANAWPTYALFTVAAASLLIAFAAWRDPSLLAHIRWKATGVKLMIYAVLGPVQALMFFGFLQTRIRTMLASAPLASEGLRRALVALLTSSGYALSHIPNGPLIALAFAVGLCWSWIFYARPNVLLLGTCHAILGTILQNVVMMYTRIGPFYAEPQRHAFVSAFPGLKALIGNLM